MACFPLHVETTLKGDHQKQAGIAPSVYGIPEGGKSRRQTSILGRQERLSCYPCATLKDFLIFIILLSC
jgi:hypothetical protein